MSNRERIDPRHNQGLHRFKPWKVVSVAFLAGAASMGSLLALLLHAWR